jgi:hypothetical protein
VAFKPLSYEPPLRAPLWSPHIYERSRLSEIWNDETFYASAFHVEGYPMGLSAWVLDSDYRIASADVLA